MSAPVVVGLSGGSGAVYAVRLLQVLRDLDVPRHLVVTKAGVQTLRHETELRIEDLRALATHTHRISDIGASIASGSFRTRGMVVAPCSIKTLSAVATSYTENLLQRAADVTLKERRRLVLVVREAPLHLGHLRLMTTAAEIGATILPPVPAFYTAPASVSDIVEQTVARILDQLDLDAGYPRWTGTKETA